MHQIILIRPDKPGCSEAPFLRQSNQIRQLIVRQDAMKSEIRRGEGYGRTTTPTM